MNGGPPTPARCASGPARRRAYWLPAWFSIVTVPGAGAATRSLGQRSPVVLADLRPGSLVRATILVVGAAGFVGLLAQISIHLSFTPVPITGQTLGVLLAGTALGWRRAGAALVLYAVAGLAGVPWFAGQASGYVGASFGYV